MTMSPDYGSENIQRHDLDPIEIALSWLIDEIQLTQNK
jgi:hypothetical protein